MTKIDTILIENAVEKAFLEIGCNLDAQVLAKLKCAKPSNKLEKFALETIIENADIARITNPPVCQDTGMAVVFVDIGQDVVLTGKYIEDAINDGVRHAYKDYRKSVVSPLSRKNTGDNTPAIIHSRIVKGDSITLSCMMKGFGSENMSRLFMLVPADGEEGVINSIVSAVMDAGSCPCPPVIVGVGIGGTMEEASILSKRALFREINMPNSNEYLNNLENIILDKINKLGIGAEGLRGDITALKVLIETAPTHIAGLPVAVTIQCHASRHKKVVIYGNDKD